MSDKEKPTGLDASLETLRQELESMQKQDKDLYKQLLGLQEGIKGLKVELKRERDECEEAYRDLQEISHSQTNAGEPTENKQNITTEQQTTPREQLKDKPSIESEANMEVQKNWKHDRQDSGISVKNYEVESSAGELTARGNGAVSSAKPAVPIIRHSKQDSGILLDDETAESETKLLSRLVQSSREFFKTDNGKLQSVHNRLRHSVLNQNPPNRSRSSSDLNKSSLRPVRDPNSRPIIPMHSHSRSCPSTAMKRFNQESCDYKVVPSHHVRPTQRSASVVNLKNLDKKDSNASYHPSAENGTRSNVMAKSEPNLGEPQAKPLRAVLVSACEVNISNTCERRDNVGVVGPQRCFTVLGPLKPGERPFHDRKHTMHEFNTSAVAQRDSGYLSLSPLQFPRNHARHHTMPENNEMRRRHSLNIWHSSSKSWDGSNMGRSRELAKMLRSSSQISLV